MPEMRNRRVRQPAADRELDALGVCTAAILGVTSEEAARIIRYLNGRFADVLKEHPADEAGARGDDA